MVRAFKRIIVFVSFVGAAFGQTTRRPEFDIANIQASAPATNPDTFASGGLLLSGRYDLRRATMLDLIGTAWGVNAEKIVGGPNWLGFDRFDLSAKAPPSTPSATVNMMLQSLLADRFKLVLHKDTRLLPAFALTVGKGKPNLKEADGSDGSGCQSQPQSGAATYSVFSCRNMTMEAFAGALRRMAGDYLPEPVVDSTGLGGSWDFDIQWNPRSRIVQAGADRITIFEAIDRQLGLKLELQQVPAPVIVVDHVDQKPTANPSGVAKILPPRSLEFESGDHQAEPAGRTIWLQALSRRKNRIARLPDEDADQHGLGRRLGPHGRKNRRSAQMGRFQAVRYCREGIRGV